MVSPITAKQLNAREGFVKNITITSAQLLAINSTPITVLAAPVNTGNALIIERIYATHAAGTAYATVNDLKFYYTNTSGGLAGTVTASGFLDSASAQGFTVDPSSCLVQAGAPIILTCSTANPVTGTFDLKISIRYRVNKIPAF